MDTTKELWDLVLKELEEGKKFSKNLIDVWFKKLELVYLDDKYAFVLTEDNGFVNLLNTKYAEPISEAFKEVMNLDITTKIFYKVGFSVEGALESLYNSNKEDSNTNVSSNVDQKDEISYRPADSFINSSTAIFDSNYTFENFIVGDSNKFAHAVSIAVANNPANQYNPLFIYGSSGLGKTHLIKAIANRISKNFPNYKTIFVKGDDFANEMIAALGNRRIPEFKEKYRKVDVLLVDDVQFFGGKKAIQEEFFHTINTLIENNKQIILTSDRPPREIKELSDRITSRFEGGVLADIQPPDTELRIAIIKSKCENLNINLSNDVLTYIGENIKSNVRQIEGVIKKLGAYMLVNSKPITIDIAKEQLVSFIGNEITPVEKAEKIIQNVANLYDVSVEDIKSKKRTADVAYARHIAIYVIKNATQLTQANIGKIFGRDHSTILSSIDVIKQDIEDKPEIEQLVSNLIKDFS